MSWFPVLVVILIVLAVLCGPRLKRWLVARQGEPDPLAEAEVYIAYGRTRQAIAVLEDALKRHPQRDDIAQKLRGLKGGR